MIRRQAGRQLLGFHDDAGELIAQVRCIVDRLKTSVVQLAIVRERERAFGGIRRMEFKKNPMEEEQKLLESLPITRTY